MGSRALPKPRISKTFLVAVLQATATVLLDHKNPENWTVAAGIIAAAISGGVRKQRDYEWR